MFETALYRYYTPEGVLLYVGISVDPRARNRAHFISSDWTKYAAFCQIEWFPTRKLAEWAEMKVIEAECPDFNLDFRAAGDFACVSDMWYLEKTGGKPVGDIDRTLVAAIAANRAADHVMGKDE